MWRTILEAGKQVADEIQAVSPDWMKMSVQDRIAEFIRLTEEGEDTFTETLIIKIDGRFKARRATPTMTSHEFAFPDNNYREYGFSYIHDLSFVTIDEGLGKAELDEVVAEIRHRFKRTPDALWNGWFTPHAKWVFP